MSASQSVSSAADHFEVIGTLEHIHIAHSARSEMRSVPSVMAIEHAGLAGDRYASQAGSFSRWPGAGRAVSLIEGEALDAIFEETGIDLRENAARRNLVTRGISLAPLVGQTFRIGGALFRADRLCLPCKHVERLTCPGVFAALRGRGGLRADVIQSGEIREGHSIDVVTIPGLRCATPRTQRNEVR